MVNKRKWFNITITVLSVCSCIGAFLMYYFYYYNLPDAPKSGAKIYLVVLIASIVISIAYLVGYILNATIFKRVYVYRLTNIISSSAFLFFTACVLILCFASIDKWIFDKNNISLFVSSSFTLLGFGLTIVAIVSTAVVTKVKNALDDKKRDYSLFDIIIPYCLLFFMGLIFSISTLLNIQYADTVFYRVTIYQSLFYSSAQILMIAYILIRSFFRFLIENV